MAYCPECRGAMPTTALVCPHCNYDFPGSEAASSFRQKDGGFAYSAFADIALMISSYSAAIGCIVAAIFGIAALVQGEFVTGLVIAPLGFFMQLGLLVVFLRVQQ